MKIISKLLCDPYVVKVLTFSVSIVEIIFSDSAQQAVNTQNLRSER